MSERRLRLPRATIRTLPEIWLVAGCLTTLVSLSLADRLVAWLIGAFPSTAILWQIRFEYLRPIAVYYDYVAMLFGGVSPVLFGAAMIAVSILIAIGSQSRVLLVRALCWHALLAAALLLVACSMPSDIQAPAGTISTPYAMLGGILSLPLAVMCLRLHVAFFRAPAPARPAKQSSLASSATGAIRRVGSLISAPQPVLVRIAARDHSAKR
jgi:hypothetical protein